jgi:hypothetical protein
MVLEPILLLIQRLRGPDCLTVEQLNVVVLEALRTCGVVVSNPTLSSIVNRKGH